MKRKFLKASLAGIAFAIGFTPLAYAQDAEGPDRHLDAHQVVGPLDCRRRQHGFRYFKDKGYKTDLQCTPTTTSRTSSRRSRTW